MRKSHGLQPALLIDWSRQRHFIHPAFQSPPKGVLCPPAWGTCSIVIWSPPSLFSSLLGEYPWLYSLVSPVSILHFHSCLLGSWGKGAEINGPTHRAYISYRCEKLAHFNTSSLVAYFPYQRCSHLVCLSFYNPLFYLNIHFFPFWKLRQHYFCLWRMFSTSPGCIYHGKPGRWGLVELVLIFHLLTLSYNVRSGLG